MRGPRSRWLRRSFLRRSNHGQARRELYATRSRAGFGSGERYGEGEELGERGGEDAFEVIEMQGCHSMSIQVSTHPDRFPKSGSPPGVVQSSIQYGTPQFATTFENYCRESGEKRSRKATSVRRTTLSMSLAKSPA